MYAKDYGAEARLLFCKTPGAKRKSLVLRRFPRAAHAIRYAVEKLAPAALDRCSLEVKEQHFFGREIRSLYDSATYPFRRRSAELLAAAQDCAPLSRPKDLLCRQAK